MSNYRVRQVMQLTRRHRKGRRWLDRHRHLLIGLATYMDDDSLKVTIGNTKLAEASGLDVDTVRLAKREMRGRYLTYTPGHHRGECTAYVVICLKEGGVTMTTPPEGGVTKSTPSKKKGGSTSKKGGVKEFADQARPDHGLNTELNLPPTGAAATAQIILAAFIDWDRERGGKLTNRTKGMLAQQIGALLTEGTEDRYIRQGLADWRARGQHPSTLDSFVNAAMNGRNGRPAPRKGDIDWDAALSDALARDAADQAAPPAQLTAGKDS